MKLKIGKNKGGFSLIEVLAAITIMAIVIGPVCAGLVVSARLNARCESLLQEQLEVKSAVETLMAEGIQAEYNAEDKVFTYKNSVIADSEGLTIAFLPYGHTEDSDYSKNMPIAYEVKVSSADGRVAVSTIIRAAEQSQTTEGGEAGA